MTSLRGWNPGSRLFMALTLALIVLMVAGAVILQYSIDDAGATGSSWKSSSPFETARSFLDILGGMRQSLAAYFWTKTDAVHHEYYEGDVTREQALYPYYWLITRLDHHFVMPYYYASYMLCRFGNTEEGLDLAIEGLRNNPYSPTLQSNLASIYFFFMGEPEKARYHILKAIELSEDDEEIQVYSNLLRIIAAVIAGEKPMPDVKTFQEDQKLRDLVEQNKKENSHESEPGEE